VSREAGTVEFLSSRFVAFTPNVEAVHPCSDEQVRTVVGKTERYIDELTRQAGLAA
jgi:hypothetical protein